MGRAPCCDKVGMKKGRWTAEEDDILTKYVQANGEGSWRSLPKNAGLLRCGKSCRLRWINYLKADLKRGNISAEEECLIVKLHASFGNRWSLIASHLPGRTDNEIKNYWNSHLSRKIYSFRGTTNNTNNTTKEIPLLQRGIIEDPPPKRKGGRTSRWAMKKNKSYVQKILIKTPKQSNVIQNNQRSAVTLPPQNNGGAEDRDGLHQLPSLDGEKNTHDDMLGPCPEVVINGGEVLGFNDIMDTCALEASGVLRRQEEEERESNNNDVVVINEEGNERGDTGCNNSLGTVDPGSSSANHSSNGELHSNSSSMASGLEENWDWESVMQLNNHIGQSVSSWEQNENLLTWLWDDDEWEKDFQIFGDIDPQKHNAAMLSWFSS